MNPRGARVLITSTPDQKIWAEDVDPRDMSMGLPGMAQAVAAMRETLPPVVRRTPRERHRAFMEKVVKEAVQSYRVTGRIEWPASALVAIKHQAAKEHDPTLLQDGGVEQIIRQGKALARYVTEQTVNRQKENDLKKVTLDWSGH